MTQPFGMLWVSITPRTMAKLVTSMAAGEFHLTPRGGRFNYNVAAYFVDGEAVFMIDEDSIRASSSALCGMLDK